MAIGNFFSKRHVKGGGDATGSRAIGKTDPRRLSLLDDFESADLGWFWATDSESKLIYLSENAAAQFGCSADELIGKPLSELFILERGEEEKGEQSPQRPLPFLLRARNTISDLPVRISIGESDDRKIWWSISGKPQLDGNGDLLGYRGSAKDITAVRQNQLEVGRMAQYDSLTGLANRHRMTKRLTTTLTAYKAAKRSCALMMLDLDRFKQVNDTLGHPAGDELLKQVGQRLERIIGGNGEIGRLGGDEFQVILPDIEDRGRLGEVAARVIQMISQPYSIDGARAIIGTSVGIAIAPYDGIDTEELVGAADLALYAAKGGGRGQYRFYSSELKDGARHRREIEEDLRDALSMDQGLEMHYQPLVDAKTHRVKCFEALIRWNHPERGWISPGDFIPVAEDTNQIGDLGEWVLRRVCTDASSWPGDISVAVNVSAVQFGDPNLPQIVCKALKDSGLDPRRLELELTESVFIGDPNATHDMFVALKKLGVALALDDFGTGYSSLGYLKNAPFDKIKIDQSFVRGSTENDNNNSAIITAIVSLAGALNMTTVAEGVEAMDELELVRERGATYIQGFIFSKAIPQDVVLEKLESGDLAFEPNGPAKHRSERKSVFRRIGVIHEDHRYDAVLRNLSKTGARIEGILNVPLGTQLVLDLGEGQLVVGAVRRSVEAEQGIEFETPLISDGADGLCTRHRVSPYMLASAGMPLAALPPGHYPLTNRSDGQKSRPQFMQLDLTSDAARAA
ncbi:putative bifunctional diguanylate cyclase/phosphodiesterase [Erythrobacter litoralis]|uniref:Sensory box/GGDEF family protein n=1 Tax=Erythrobacter litoralis (strain HTCC2594) TaxID=314225 RepID=Q2N9U4_ERYLH|nr:EAL domain-containing protein [Erythrobacter litoralis]ABC63547.1 sensory box/GGDEF family protein [Erythrobacter litoralis HTCC2594]